MFVAKGQTSEMFALHQHHLVYRRHSAVFIFTVRGRGRIRHTLNLGQPTPIGSPDFAKNSTALALAGFSRRRTPASGVANRLRRP